MSRAPSTTPGALSRREFVHGVAAFGGGLTLSLRLAAADEGEAAQASSARPAIARPISAFVQIAANDTITFYSPAVEMGQGGHTGMPMILIEELAGDWKRVKVLDAPPAKVYNNPLFGQQSTVGSFSVRGWYAELRKLGAAAREMLVTAAARQWGVPASECSAAASVITHARSGRHCTYGSVAISAAYLPVPANPRLKSNAEFTLIGTSPARLDVPEKTDGSAVYGVDVRLPGMLYGAVKTSPTLSGRLKSFDDAAARGVAGFRATVPLTDGVIVLADSWWQAKKALDVVKLQFEPGHMAKLDSAQISAQLRAAFNDKGKVARNDGNVDAALASAAQVVEADYEVPFLAHACMEPMNCTARVDANGCEVWCGTQSPQAAQGAAATAAGLPPEKVKVNNTYLGGGFGRRGEADYVSQAVTAAKAVPGRPVKLLWTREEDIQHDFYRPAAAIRFRAGLDAAGKLTALDCRVISASQPVFMGPDAPSFYTGGVSDANYSIPNWRVSGINKNFGVRFGFWRSVNDSHNPFMLDGMLDEIAARAKQDPYEFRRALLAGERGRRQLAALDMAADKAGWKSPRPGHTLGIASIEAFGSFIACVADVSLQGETVVIHRIVTAIDCGTAVHPANIKAQLEGGMVYGLSAVLRGEITLQDGAVTQGNFHDYPMLLMAEMPVTECYIVPSTAPPGGVGEPGTGPIAPALCNAISAATGRRIRSLPLSRHKLQVTAARA